MALFNSIRSLLLSKTTFNKLTVYCIGHVPSRWKFSDPRINVVGTQSLREDFFFANKVLALQSGADVLIYLDADTLVLKPIDSVYRGCTAQLIGRPDSLMMENSRKEQWQRTLAKRGINESPYFNAGFFIMQGNVPSAFESSWINAIDFLLKNPSEVHDLHSVEGYPKELCRHFTEQVAFSLCVGKLLSSAIMDPKHHAYGWKRESDEGVVVYHTGSTSYHQIARELQKKYQLLGKKIPLSNRLNRIEAKRWKERLLFEITHAKRKISWFLGRK